jgi:uncharacterized protein YqgV (UPF0045/DUF77 family)
VIAEIQCLPRPSGRPDDRHAHVDAAIAIVRASGLHHEVGALGTTVEGPSERVWPLLRAVHDACLAAGADSVVTVIKVAESTAGNLAMDDLTAKFR